MNEFEKRGVGRPRKEELRPTDTSRNESLARAEQRVRELRGQFQSDRSYVDKFWAPDPPDGWSYQWNTKTIYNQENPGQWAEYQRQGWEPVPVSRHPEMMPRGWKGETIEIDGMVLMERPKILTDEARASEQREAFNAVRAKEMQLGHAPQGQFARSGQKISKGYEPIPVDND